jgi:geranylgeranylglycerol-phosphate geranylgeranyltransferase
MAQVIEHSLQREFHKPDFVQTLRRIAVSQFVLLNYRKRWGLIYSFATLAGILCMPGIIFGADENSGYLFGLATIIISLPLGSFMIIVGMYVLNDLIDSDLDRTNGKGRPIPTGIVTKGQACIFVFLTNIFGVSLCFIGNDITGAIISLGLVAIGIMYSAPKLCLKDRFVVKTLAIAVAMMLCVILGSSSSWATTNVETRTSYDQLLLTIYIALMLGCMVFITSPFNDVADMKGDLAAGRKTIPIVIGAENTVRLGIFIAASMIAASWLMFSLTPTGWIMPLLVSAVSALTMVIMYKTLRRLGDHDYARKQHKKSMPLHLMVQLALVVGALAFWL